MPWGEEEYLFKPLKGVFGQVILLRMVEQILHQRGEDCLEVGTVGGGHDGSDRRAGREVSRSKREQYNKKSTIEDHFVPPLYCFVSMFYAVYAVYNPRSHDHKLTCRSLPILACLHPSQIPHRKLPSTWLVFTLLSILRDHCYGVFYRGQYQRSQVQAGGGRDQMLRARPLPVRKMVR